MAVRIGAVIALCASLNSNAIAEPVMGVDDFAHVERLGEGDQTLVMIPGMLSDWRVWEEFAERNAERYTMYLVTLAGFDGGDGPDPPPDAQSTSWIDQAARGVGALIEQEQLDSPIVVGHALGGQVAILAGLEHSDLIAGVVTIDGLPRITLPRPIPGDQRAIIVEMTVGADLRQTTDEGWRLQVDFLLNQFDEERRPLMASMFSEVQKSVGVEYTIQQFKLDLAERISELQMPALGVVPTGPAAARGGMQVARLKRDWDRQARDAERFDLVFVDDGSHYLMFSNPEALDSHVSAFAASVTE